MAITLATVSTVHNSSAFDVPIRLFRQFNSVNLLARCCVLYHLSSDLVYGVYGYRPTTL